MAIVFIGRLNTMEPPRQVFTAGVMKVKGATRQVVKKVSVPALGEDGKPKVDKAGKPVMGEKEQSQPQTIEYSFRPKDIGKKFEVGEDEAHLLAKYPGHFKKA